MIAAIYARKSTADTDKHEQARSCEQQLAAGREFCQRRGWTVGQTFRDDGISGAEVQRRPGFKALRDALEATPRPFDIVVVMEFSGSAGIRRAVWRRSRKSRTPRRSRAG